MNLTGVKSGEDWDHEDIYNGVRYIMTSVVEEASATINTAIVSASTLGIGQIVAQTMIINSTRFLWYFVSG